MDHKRFREWFSHVDELTAAQCKEVAAVLSDPPEGAASLAAIELGVDDERRCPHCASAGAVSRGKARGRRRYRCKACGKTFGALTGTALSGLHHKERWLAFGASLGAGETIREAAERCRIAPSTAHRWRHRFLAAVRQAPDRLAGIVEADETFVLESRKGERKLDRKPRRQGPQTRPLARAGADPGRRRSRRRDPQPPLARPQRKEREGGAGAGRRPAMPCSSPTPTAAIRPSQRRWTSLTRASTAPPASGFAAPCTSRRSTAATARSRISCGASAASPPSTSTAISGGSISSNSAISHRPERVTRRRWPDHAYASLIEPR